MGLQLTTPTVGDIRNSFADLYIQREFVKSRDGQKTIEIIGAQFFADEETIFGKVNHDYIGREFEWYRSQSRMIKDFPEPIPRIWKQIASNDGMVQSNYGWCVFNPRNHNQYSNCLNELLNNHNSRRAVMIYTRPTMWYEYNWHGMNDFICTNVVQYFIRNDKLHSYVQMRSCDAWSGYRNDLAWQGLVLNDLTKSLKEHKYVNLEPGQIIWNCGSLHLYENQFYLIDHFIETGNFNVSKEEIDGYRNKNKT